MTIIHVLKYNWFISAIKEALNQPAGRKLKHLRYRLLWELQPMFKWSGRAPLAVDVELSSECNFRCVFCQKNDKEFWDKNEEEMMNWDTFKKIVDECVQMGVYSMKVNWRGEPTLNPHLADYIFYMKQSGIHEVMMNTNGSKLTVELADKIIHSGIDRVIFSCDGISSETYNKIRRGGDWHKFIENVRMFDDRRKLFKSLGKKVPIVRINTAIMDENKHEIPLFQETFDGIVDELRFNTLYNPQKKNKFLGKRKREVKRKGCPQIYQRMIVSSEGDATVCCADYQKKLKLGNIHSSSLSDMYQIDQEKIRDTHEAHNAKTLDGCRNCDLFSLSEKKGNKVVWV